MGGHTQRDSYSDADYLAFAARLREQLDLLGKHIASGRLDGGTHSIGGELEIYLVDQQFRPLPRNLELLEQLDDPLLQLELNRFNLEYNLAPQLLKDRVFSEYASNLNQTLQRIEQAANSLDGHVVAIGILPGLTSADFVDCMTDTPRYHALADNLRRIRGEPFRIRIEGEHDRLETRCDDVSLEGANTSWQLHLRVGAETFTDWFNAIQLVTPVALGIAGNSPMLFGHNLWDETRIALFRQSIDSRTGDAGDGWRQPARVSLGDGWLRRSPLELFSAAVALYPPILPEITEAPANQLSELRLHMGTVWHWNRPVYDPVDGGHLRIEMRALPAGPSAIDMLANSAFLIGAANALRGNIEALINALPFRYCQHNFLSAARYGLQARILWPCRTQSELFERPLGEVIRELLPLAREGLKALGVEGTEAARLCGVIEARNENRQTGSNWLRRTHALLGGDNLAGDEMMRRYHGWQRSGQPVHEWSIEK